MAVLLIILYSPKNNIFLVVPNLIEYGKKDQAIKDDPGIKGIIGDVPYHQFLISLENFNIFYKEKNTEAYVHFFNKYYKN